MRASLGRWLLGAVLLVGAGAGLVATPAPAAAQAGRVCGPEVDTPVEGWVCMLYNLELGRSPGAAELGYWTSIASSNGPGAVSHGLVFSPEATSRHVALVYQAQLGRDADPAGLAFWSGLIQSDRSELGFERGVFTSPEFLRTFPSTPDYVRFLYEYYLGRDGDGGGVAFWSGELTSGRMTAGQVLGGFQSSTEAGQLMAKIAYRDLLERGADPGGLAFWGDRGRQFGLLRLLADMGAQPEVISVLGAEGQSATPGFPDPLFTILDAVVAVAPATPGSPCPVPVHQAPAASAGHTMVICGTNNSFRPARPTAASAGLGGSFVAGRGAFTSARIRSGTASVVLGNFAAVTVTTTVGTGRTVDVQLGAPAPGRVRGTATRTLGGYTVLSRPPNAINDAATTTEDATTAIPVLANDTDPDPGDTLTVTAVGATSNGGTATIANAGANVSFDPGSAFQDLDTGENRVTTFTYTVTDSHGVTDTATVTVTVTGLDDDPVAVDDAATTPEDTALVVPASGVGSPAANDTDVDGETLTVTAVSAPTNGTVGLAAGQITFTPTAQFCGTGGYDYTVSDGDGATDTGHVTVTVTCVNDAPVVGAETFTLPENSPNATVVGDVDFTDADTGQTHTFSITGGNTGGAFAIGSTSGQITVANSAALDFETTPTFNLTVQVTDNGSPVLSGTATITVNLTDVNEAPVVNDATFNVAENQTPPVLVGTPTSSDPDVGQTRTWSITAGNGAGDFTINTSTGAISTADSLDAEGIASYSLTVQVTDNGAPALNDTATVTINVTNVNEAPVLTVTSPLNAQHNQNRNLTGITVADVDSTSLTLTLTATAGRTLTAATVAGGATPTGSGTNSVSLTGTVAELTTTLGTAGALTYNDNNLAGTTDVVTVALTDGALSDNDSITIQFNVPPVVDATAGSLAYTENDAATVIDSGITVTDTDAGGLASATVQITTGCAPSQDVLALTSPPAGITVVSSPGTCLLSLTGNAPAGDYQTALRAVTYANSSDAPTAARTVTFTAVDDAAASGSDTRGIAITAVDDNPVAVDDTFSTNEDTNLVLPATGAGSPAANDIDVDGDTKTVTAVTNPTNGTVGLAAGQITFTPTAQFCGTAGFDYTVSDGAGPTDDGHVTVTVDCVADAPTVATTSGSAAYPENAAPVPIDPTVVVTDADGTLASATVQITDNYQNGQDVLSLGAGAPGTITAGAFDAPTGTLTLTGPASVEDFQAALRLVQYSNTSDDPSTLTRTATFTVTDGVTTPGSDSRTITVTATNDAPVVTLSGTAPSYTEDSGTPATVDTGLTIDDPDDTNIESATVAVTAGTTQTGDALGFTPAAGITLDGSSTATSLVFTGSAPVDTYRDLLRSVTFTTTNQDPSTSRTIRFQVSDGDAPSTFDDKTVTVVPVNDAPVVDTTAAAGSALEQVATAVDTGITVDDVDSDIVGATVQVTGNYQTGQDVLAIPGGQPGGITGLFNAGSGTLTLSGAATTANYEAALRAVTYTNTSDTPSTLTRTVTFTVTDDGTPGLTGSDTRNLTVVPVNDAPTDSGEAQTATGNTRLEVELTTGQSSNPKRTSATGNLLDNSADVDDATNVLTVDVATVTDPPHGTVVVNADGSYVYTPDAGYTGADSFTYRVKDDENAQSAVSTVSITVATRVWYVRADAAAGGDGRSETPFDTLDAADTAATATGDTIYVFRRTGDTGTVSDASLDLLASQVLLGSAVDLTDGAATLYIGSAGLTPSLTATSVKLDDGNTVRGLSISGTGAPAIVAANGDTNGTLDQLSVGGAAGGIELANGATGTWNLSNLTVATTGGDAIRTATAGTVNFTPTGTISVSSSNGRGLNLSGTTTSGTVDSTTVTSSPTDGIVLDDNPGSLTLNDINLTTTGTALTVDSSNAVTISGGDADINSTGPAVSLTTNGSTPADPPDITLDQVTSSGGVFGIVIDDIGIGTFSASGGTLSGHTSAELDVNAGSGAISYAGAISNGSGLSVDVTNRTGGTITLSGAITDTNDANGGVSLTSNTGGTIAFTGGMSLSTGAQPAFAATGVGSTVTATQNNTTIVNTLDSTSGSALNVTNTTIGAAGLTFRSIAAGAGAGNGITLSNTGAGSLTVTGNGGVCTVATPTCTGGTIAGRTGADGSTAGGIGVFLNNTGPVSLTRMSIQANQNYGIRGTTVSGFTLDNSLVGTASTNGTIDSADPEGGVGGEASIRFSELTGTATVSNSALDRGLSRTMRVRNTAGTLNLTIDNSRVDESLTSGAAGTNASDALWVETLNSATMNLTVTNSQFTAYRQFAIQGNTGNTSTMSYDIHDNDFSNSNAANVSAAASLSLGSGDVTGSPDPYVYANIHDNTFRHGAAGSGTAPTNGGAHLVYGLVSGAGKFDLRFVNNTVGVSGVVSSGAGNGADALRLFHSGDAGTTRVTGTTHSRFLVTGNIIQRYGEAGIQLNARQSASVASPGPNAGVIDATILNNIIREPGTAALGAFAGIWVNAGALPGDSNVVNVAIGGTGVLQANTLTQTDPNNFSDVFLDANGCNCGTSSLNLYRNGSAAGGSGEALVRQILVDDNIGPLDLLAGFTNGTIGIQSGLPPQPP